MEIGAIILWILTAALGIGGLYSFAKKTGGPESRRILNFVGVFLIGLTLFFVLLQTGLLSGVGLSKPFTPPLVITAEGGGAEARCGNGLCEGAENSVTCPADCPSGEATFQPTASYVTKDLYTTNTVGGTSYYKVGDLPATTTAKTNVKVGTTYTYWVSNGTTYTNPKIFTAKDGVNDVVADGWRNSSMTITAYDTTNHRSIDIGRSNATTAGADAQIDVDLTFQGTAKYSSGPFGGAMLIETNKSVSSITCTGNELLSTNPYHVTYTVLNTGATYKIWGYSSELDDGTAKAKVIHCQFKVGASAASGQWVVKLLPANYYATNDGEIVLDIEKYANDDTAITRLNEPTIISYFG